MVTPARQSVSADDRFLIVAATKILGESKVATSTARGLLRIDVDAARLAELLKRRGPEAEVGGFQFKFIDADPETPDDFGVLVRLKTPLSGT